MRLEGHRRRRLRAGVLAAGDYYHHDEAQHALVGKRTGETFSLGETVEVRLVEAIPTAGALRFEMLSEGKARRTAAMRLPRSGPRRHRR